MALLIAGIAAALLASWLLRGTSQHTNLPASSTQFTVDAKASEVTRGAYLARVGNCALCHTAPGGEAYAGGRGIDTPFGTIYAGNITPDSTQGIGAWTAGDFWNALHAGKSRDGHLLYPAFPYTSFTQVSRADADALYAYLRSVPASTRSNTPHTLRWPYSTQWALAAWRLLYFTPAETAASATPPLEAAVATRERGAYLVQGLGHCSACHGTHNALGGVRASQSLSGGKIPAQDWMAPPLGGGNASDLQAYLQTGASPLGYASGPMAEVVLHSTQYLSDVDAQSMADYLASLPADKPSTDAPVTPPTTRTSAQGAALYDKHCAECHGKQGQGQLGAYPALAGSAAVNRADPNNLVQIVWRGGFAPATAANPRPYGMPPFLLQLHDQEVAAILTYIRTSWGNQAGAVSEFDINRLHPSQPR